MGRGKTRLFCPPAPSQCSQCSPCPFPTPSSRLHSFSAALVSPWLFSLHKEKEGRERESEGKGRLLVRVRAGQDRAFLPSCRPAPPSHLPLVFLAVFPVCSIVPLLCALKKGERERGIFGRILPFFFFLALYPLLSAVLLLFALTCSS